MIEYLARIGSTLPEAIQQALQLAKNNQQPVKLDFREVEVVVNDGDDPKALEATWEAASAKAEAAHRASPEYRQEEAKKTEDVREHQQRVEDLMSRLGSLDFGVTGQVIKFFGELTDATIVGVTVDRRRILDAFAAHGYALDLMDGADSDGMSASERDGWHIIFSMLYNYNFHGFVDPYTELQIHRWRQNYPTLWPES